MSIVVNQYREREDKYDVGLDWVVPDLTGVLPPGARVRQRTVSLSSQYFDTAGRALLRNGVTLRLRSGDTDTGWQLKVPEGNARTELRVPAEASGRAVPAELRQIVYGICGGAPLRPVATIDTARTITRLTDAAETVLAEIDDDDVTGASTQAGQAAQRWREVEVELGSGDEQLLSAIGQRLRADGATPADSPSKLARVLGEPSGPATPRRPGTIGDLVTGYLQAQYTALINGDLALRRGQNAIHPTRVATRRYRSVLRVFGDLFDSEAASALDRELAWYAGLLGAVRDGDVLGRHLAQTASALPTPVEPSVAMTPLDAYLAQRRDAARLTLLRQMRSKRYLALLATLRAWHEAPPLTEAAAGRPKTVSGYLDRAGRTVTKRLKRARRDDAADEVLHRARKAGKRARYTAELAVPTLGKPARRVVKRATRLQDAFGEYQDSIIASELLLSLGTAGDAAPNGGAASDGAAARTAFAYGLLYASEQLRGLAAREHARALKWH